MLDDFRVGNARNNRTRTELDRTPGLAEAYALPLTIWREESDAHTVAEPAVFYFQSPADRAAFARLFEALGYSVKDGEA